MNFDPLPLVSNLGQSVVLKSRKLTYYVRFWLTLPPPGTDII